MRKRSARYDAVVSRWLEITPDYRCNNRCVGCFSVDDHGPSMTPTEAITALDRAGREGTTSLWLGGGEPTLRRDLFALATAARSRGFDRIKLQTNGMMLAYAAFVQRCVDAGITEVSFSIKGAIAETHDRLTRTPGCFDLMLAGIERARAAGLTCEGDVLVYASNAGELPRVVDAFAPRGISHFRVWLLSAAETNDPNVRAEVPRMRDVVPALSAAHDAARTHGVVIESLHTPACVLPADRREIGFDVASLALTVVNPGGHSFSLESSPIEGGAFLPTCERCALRTRCRGLRADYLAIHGDTEFAPIQR